MEMSYRGFFFKIPPPSHMKPCVRLPCYHWSQAYIFPSLLSSPLISPLLLFGVHTVWRRMMNTQLSKALVLGGPFFFFFLDSRSPHTHTHAVHFHYASVRAWRRWDKWTTMLCPTVRPTLRLIKSCITTPNFKSEIGCLCSLSHLQALFFRVLRFQIFFLPPVSAKVPFCPQNNYLQK